MYTDRPVGIKIVSFGPRLILSSMAALRSSPADPSVEYTGTDFINLLVSLESENESINFKGHGYCVTPGSNCVQDIQAFIGAKNRANVFSKIISSGIVNPLFGSIILGSLISSPSADSSDYDHEIRLEVKGSSIKINGKPLI